VFSSITTPPAKSDQYWPVWTNMHQCTMQDGWYVDREHSSVVFLPIANHDRYPGTNHPHVSTYLLTYLPTEAGRWVGNHLHSLPTYLLWLPINIGSWPRWCAVEVGKLQDIVKELSWVKTVFPLMMHWRVLGHIICQPLLKFMPMIFFTHCLILLERIPVMASYKKSYIQLCLPLRVLKPCLEGML
jgi:hypothetical protein